MSEGSNGDGDRVDPSRPRSPDPLMEGSIWRTSDDRHTVDPRVARPPVDPASIWEDDTDVDDEGGGADDTGRLTISTTPDGGHAGYDSARQARLMSNRRRQWPRALAGLGMLAVGAAAAVFLLDLDNFGGSDDDESVDEAQTEADGASTTIAADTDGPPAFGEARAASSTVVVAPRAGQLTAIGDVDEAVGRGSTLAAIDGEPTLVMFGSVPFERALEPGAEGDDVAQLQANLVALGITTPDALPVTGEYDAATGAAVTDWEEQLGLAGSGVVPVGRLTASPGPGTLGGALPVGTEVALGDPIGSLDVPVSHADVVQPGGGTVTGMLPPGTAIAHGDIMMYLDETPVVAVSNGSPVDGAVIDAMASGDNEQLEQVLVFFGFDPDGQIVIDAEGDLATIAAVNRWRRATGFGEAFAIGPQFYLEVPRDAVVESTYVPDGLAIAPGTLAYTVSAPAGRVVATVDAAAASEYGVGQVVELESSDGATFEAVVESVPDEAASAGTESVEIVLDPVGEVDAIGPVWIAGTRE